MGLQKGQSGYAFRWLIPIFSLLNSLAILINGLVLALVVGGMDSAMGFFGFNIYDIFGEFSFMANNVMTWLKVYTASVWLVGIMMLTLAIMAFAMNRKGSYIFGVIGGAVSALMHLVKMCLYFYVSSVMPLRSAALKLGFYMLGIFAFAVCICIFSAIAMTKCEYEKTVGERNIAGENLTYVGFSDETAGYASQYHESGVQGRVNPYEPPVEIIPDPEPVKPEKYVPNGPSGKITGVVGMYRGVSFDIVSNEELVIGRDPRIAQIVIGEGAQNVSREHCRITYNAADNSFSVMDMSKNGTYSAATRSKLPHKVYTRVPVGTEIYLGDKGNMFRLG